MPQGITHLFIPGPTNVPEAVRRAMNVPMQDHRAPDFPDLVHPLFEGLSTVLGNHTGRVFLWPGSGTGAWEAAITNTLNPGDRVLMARHGQFSLLWADMAQRLGLDVICIDTDWGNGVPLEQYADHLAHDRSIKGVFVTHNETSTGVTSNVPAVRRILDDTGSDALLYVDGVSSIASLDFQQDTWGVDLAVTGSQKGLMLPPGLAILGVSPKALTAAEHTTGPRAYFHFADMIKTNDAGYFPYTPPLPLLHGLRAALNLLLDEGLPHVHTRHHHNAEGIRRGITALGLDLYPNHPDLYSDTVTTITLPDHINGHDLIHTAYHRHHTSFGGGLNKLAGKVFRIGHLGDLNHTSCLTALAAAEMALTDTGAKIEPGAAVAAAQEYYRQNVTAS